MDRGELGEITVTWMALKCLPHFSQRVIHIQQPCSHPVQFGGMCAVCGKDISE